MAYLEAEIWALGVHTGMEMSLPPDPHSGQRQGMYVWTSAHTHAHTHRGTQTPLHISTPTYTENHEPHQQLQFH